VALWAEYSPNPALQLASGEMFEGKETRFGIGRSVLWAVSTTAASNGSVNAMHDSFSPLAGGVMMMNMLLGEIIFGGVGSGLYGMILFVILTVFMAGLMVGRSPEYLGKRIEAFEVKMAMIGVLAPAGTVLVLTGVASIYPPALQSLTNTGPHGLSEILYAFASMSNNNGSAFAGLNANTPFYNYTGAAAMLIGRYAPLFATIAIAGSLGQKRLTPPSSGAFPTHSPLFVLLLIGVILIVGALTFFPALTLGPILEHLLSQAGTTL
jgi:K+-transporting ATPase ATPase A chain